MIQVCFSEKAKKRYKYSTFFWQNSDLKNTKDNMVQIEIALSFLVRNLSQKQMAGEIWKKSKEFQFHLVFPIGILQEFR